MAIIIKIPTGICVGLIMQKKDMKEERHVTFLNFEKYFNPIYFLLLRLHKGCNLYC